MIGVMVPSTFALEANPKNVDVSSSSVEVNITGNIGDFKSYQRLILTVTSPDKSETEYDVRVTGNGIFSKIFTVSNEWDYGTYDVTAKYGDQDLGFTSFMIEPPYDPRLGIKNNVEERERIEPEPIVENFLNQLSIGTLESDKTIYLQHHQCEKDHPLSLCYTSVKISGDIFNMSGGNEVIISLIRPDGVTVGEKAFLTGSGHYETTFTIAIDSIQTYRVMASYNGQVIGQISFNVEPTPETVVETKLNQEPEGLIPYGDYVQESNAKYLDIHVDNWMSNIHFIECYNSSDCSFSKKMFIDDYGLGNIVVIFGKHSSEENAIEYNESRIDRLVNDGKFPIKEMDRSKVPSGCIMYERQDPLWDSHPVRCAVGQYSIKIDEMNFGAPTSTIQEFTKKIVENIHKHNQDILKINNLKKLIPDNYHFEEDNTFRGFGQYFDGGYGLIAINEKLNSIDGTGIVTIIQFDNDDELMKSFHKLKSQNSRIGSAQVNADLSATCFEGFEILKDVPILSCYKGNLIILVISHIDENYITMKQILDKMDHSEGGGCLIATATYGSELAPQVQQLRELRDNQLLQTESGTQFMTMFNDIYYSFSPVIADYERENPYFKEVVKIAITPMISSLSLMENVESESEVLGMGLSVIMLNIGMYLGIPAVVIVGIRKRI